MRITNLQQNELSIIFNKSGLNLIDFDVTRTFTEFKIKYKYEYFSCSINLNPDFNYNIAIYPINDIKGVLKKGDWKLAKFVFNDWCNRLVKELNMQTGWDTFQSENYLNVTYDEIDQKFDEKEKIIIWQSINELKERIKSLEISGDKLIIIEKKLDYLSEQIEKLSIFDWKSLFMGSILNLILTNIIPQNMCGIVWGYIKIAFSVFKLTT
jgi:hypothetical protein